MGPQHLNTPNESHDEASAGEDSDPSLLNFSTNDLVIVKTEELEEEEGQDEPLDLSLPKSSSCNRDTSLSTSMSIAKQSAPAQEEPLNLTCLKKDTLPSNTIYVAQSATGPINIIATPLPTLLAIAEPGGVPCLGTAISTKQRTILIPQLSYTYATPSANSTTTTTISASSKSNTVSSPTTTDTQGTVVLNGIQVRQHSQQQLGLQ